jgi:two-component system, chemotaxis family, sensor kinase CheA
VPIRGGDVSARVERVHRYEVLRLREQLLPLVRLTPVLGLTPTFTAPDAEQSALDRRQRWSDRRASGSDLSASSERRARRADRRQSGELRVAILRMGTRRFGLVVDEIHDHEEIVVKPLPTLLKAARCYCGATIMGDASVAMILDPAGIAEMAGFRFDELEEAARERESARAVARVQEQEDEILVFSAGGPERLAVPLRTISRIEKHQASEIEVVGTRAFVRSADSSLELLRMEDFIPVGRAASEPASLFVVVPRSSGAPIGFRATHISDTVRTHLHVDSRALRGDGVRGSAMIGGEMVLVLDMPALLKTAANRAVSLTGAQ